MNSCPRALSAITVRVSPCMVVSGKGDLGNPRNTAWKAGWGGVLWHYAEGPELKCHRSVHLPVAKG